MKKDAWSCLDYKDKLLIIGASGHGKVVADIAMKMNEWQQIDFLDDDISLKNALGIDIIGKSTDASDYFNESNIFVAIGDNLVRAKIQDNLIKQGAVITTLIHPNAVIGTAVEIGIGTVVMAGAVINSDTKIGRGCIINTGATVDHDNMIEDYVHISPGATLCGTVSIGKCTHLGAGAIVRNSVCVCGDCVIGAGAVVVKNLTEKGTYIGLPARRK